MRRPELGGAPAGAQTGFVDLPESYYHRPNSAEAAVTKKKTDNESDTDRLWDAATKAKEEAEKMRDAATHAIAVVHVAHEALAVAQKKAAEAKVAADKAERHALDEAEKARKALETQLNLARQDQTQPPQNESTGGYAIGRVGPEAQEPSPLPQPSTDQPTDVQPPTDPTQPTDQAG